MKFWCAVFLLIDLAGVVAAWRYGQVLIYVITALLMAFAAFALDKFMAVYKFRRFPERYLWLLTALGGGLGALAAMFIFRHKVRKLKFSLAVVVLTVCQLVLYGLLRRW